MALVIERTFAWSNQLRRLRPRYEKGRYAQGASLARVRSDLLEFPTGSLSVIRAFQTDKPQMRKLRRVSFHGRLRRLARYPTATGPNDAADFAATS